MLACVFLLPGIVAVALLGPLPLRRCETRLRDQLASGIGELESSTEIGAVVAFVVAFTVWAAVLVGGRWLCIQSFLEKGDSGASGVERVIRMTTG